MLLKQGKIFLEFRLIDSCAINLFTKVKVMNLQNMADQLGLLFLLVPDKAVEGSIDMSLQHLFRKGVQWAGFALGDSREQ